MRLNKKGLVKMNRERRALAIKKGTVFVEQGYYPPEP